METPSGSKTNGKESRKSSPDVTINRVDNPLNLKPKILGVTLDTMLCFKNHAAAIYAEAVQRLNILCAIASFNWGHNRKTLLITYRALIESVLNFAAPVWFPNCKPMNLQKLQFVQKAALRLVTGCHKATDIGHFHAKAKIMPVVNLLSMLCSQFLSSCMRRSHPSHATIKIPPGSRKNKSGRPMKETLSSKFGSVVEPYLSDGIISEACYNRTKSEIHTAAVHDSLAVAAPNPVLGVEPPPVLPSERALPHAYCTTLSQLRSGKCSCLPTYQHFIKIANVDVCPACHNAPHSTKHLFSCPAFPTTLTVLD
jgi:hypothetical protein